MIKAMSPANTLVSVDEYLRTNYKPACEYRDGVLTQKPMPTGKHAFLQTRIGHYILSAYNQFWVGSELTVRLSDDRYVVPDVAVQYLDRVQNPYPTKPIPLCVEIISPEDRFSEVMAKGQEYLDWGVPIVWIIDPEKCRAWEFTRERGLHEAHETLTAGEISISVASLFAGL